MKALITCLPLLRLGYPKLAHHVRMRMRMQKSEHSNHFSDVYVFETEKLDRYINITLTARKLKSEPREISCLIFDSFDLNEIICTIFKLFQK